MAIQERDAIGKKEREWDGINPCTSAGCRKVRSQIECDSHRELCEALFASLSFLELASSLCHAVLAANATPHRNVDARRGKYKLQRPLSLLRYCAASSCA